VVTGSVSSSGPAFTQSSERGCAGFHHFEDTNGGSVPPPPVDEDYDCGGINSGSVDWDELPVGRYGVEPR
jgi:hypothetical protein